MMLHIGILGVGELSEKIVKGLITSQQNITVHLSPRNSCRAAALANNAACQIEPTNQAVIDKSDLVLLGIRPAGLAQLAKDVCFRPQQQVISLLAGVSVAQLTESFAHTNIVRLMLTYAAEIQRTTVVLSAVEPRLTQLFSGLGQVVTLEEEAHFELATVAMCMNGWFYSFAGQLENWFIQQGLNGESARQLVLGALRDCADYASHHATTPLDQLAASIATPGTYTAQGQKILEARDALTPWLQAAEEVKQSLIKRPG